MPAVTRRLRGPCGQRSRSNSSGETASCRRILKNSGDRSWLPVWRRLTKPSAAATRWNSRAVALGMHDFGSVLRQLHPAVPMLLRDQCEDLFEFGQGRFSGVHERVAASKSRDLGHPRSIVLPVQHDFVVVKSHGVIVRLSRTGPASGSWEEPGDLTRDLTT